MEGHICILPSPDGCYVAWRALDGEDAHNAGRQLLERLYAHVTGEAMPPVSLTNRGKPYFENGAWHFSISHTPKYVFCCLSRENVGIDAEETDRDAPKTPAYLSEAERQRWDKAEDRQQAFLRLWVLKEAYAKLTGRGLGCYLKETNFSPDDPRITQIAGCYVAVLTDTGKDDIHAF